MVKAQMPKRTVGLNPGYEWVVFVVGDDGRELTMYFEIERAALAFYQAALEATDMMGCWPVTVTGATPWGATTATV